MEVVLNWSGPMPIFIETPKGGGGKHGIFAFVYNKKEIIYIGKSLGKQYHLYQESKHRYKSLKKAFNELGLMDMNHNNVERKILADKYCEKYVAELVDYSYTDLERFKLGNAEKLLIFKMQPKGNVHNKKRYSGVIPIKVINNGPITDNLLLDYYEVRI